MAQQTALLFVALVQRSGILPVVPPGEDDTEGSAVPLDRHRVSNRLIVVQVTHDEGTW